MADWFPGIQVRTMNKKNIFTKKLRSWQNVSEEDEKMKKIRVDTKTLLFLQQKRYFPSQTDTYGTFCIIS